MTSPANSIPDTALGLSREDVSLLRQHQATLSPQRGGTTGGLLDSNSLAALGYHFDRLMYAIQQRLEVLSEQTQISVQTQAQGAQHAMAMADAEMERLHDILHQIDELEREFDKIRHIRDIVKGFRGRVEVLDRRMKGR